MRRAILPFLCCAALTAAVPASARLVPVQRTYGERTLPRLRAGVLRAPDAAARLRVIATLALPPLAQRFGRGLYASGRHKLDLRNAASRAYLRRLESAQAREATALRRAIPQARIGRRFQVVLDGMTVSLPPSKLPALVRLRSVAHVYPSLVYTLATDRSPSLIGADVVRQQLGADGAGIKIGVVDDGIDQTNPFFDSTGLAYPAGFPRGGRKWTSPKVIVARAFPGPGSGAPGRLAVDPNESFHGTHVAGIAAGDSGTTAPAGADHPQVTGLSGVAPRAWLGNYRVFTVPLPPPFSEDVANSPEIIAAFEAAVKDGMDVINFSGGGPQIDPVNDVLVDAIHNVAAAGVVPVIAAGNDRDEFGNGSVGSPGTAPDAISVAAVSNTHVFAPALDVTAPDAPSTLKGIPFIAAGGSGAPPEWGSFNQTLVDVGSVVGHAGQPVERHLCGPPGDLASTAGELAPHSLDGDIVLAERGLCPFVTKALQAKAAGAIGLVLSDNRQGEANPIPVLLAVPGGMISNLDGGRLRAYLAGHGGRTTVHIGRDPLELETGRSGVVTSFSSAGPTAFGHDLKPDISAPGGQVLSSTLPNTDRSRFAVFDGTSMATPHVTGSAALLLQLHPAWTPEQVRSALVSTAGAAWGDTARTQEAPVPLEGAGLVWLPRAAAPQLFTQPASLSFGNVVVTSGAGARGLLVRLTDAGNGAGTWQVELAPQVATPGSAVDVPGTVSLAPGGEADLPVVARAAAGAPQGEDYGFVVLRKGDVTRRVPYFFLVDHPALADEPALPLRKLQAGTTATGVDHVDAYRYPTSPFGNPPDTPAMVEDGAEKLYVTSVDRPAANAGVSVELASAGARPDPFYLGAQDESTVQGFAGTPVNVNGLMFDYLLPVGAAGSSFPRQAQFFVAVDSGHETFTDRRLAGGYILRSWVNDVTPPTLRLLTTRVAAGRPTIVVRTRDSQSGVDPLSITIGYRRALVGAVAYDPVSGIAVIPLPRAAPRLRPGRVPVGMESADFQETKNVDTVGSTIEPNTRFALGRLRVVSGTAVDWLFPSPGACLTRPQRVVVAASSTKRVARVRFLIDGKRVAAARSGGAGLWVATFGTGSLRAGRHTLEAQVFGAHGRTASASRSVRACRK